MSVQQYPRRVSIAIGKGGSALDFSQFRVQFAVKRGDYQNPNSADVRIFNLSDETASRIQNEFDTVAIQAGYEGNYGPIFSGTIKQVRKGRANQKDTYVDVTAADGDEAYNFSTVSLSLAAGTQPGGVASALLTAMQSKGITAGYQPNFPTNGSVRGTVYYGMARDELRDFAQATGVSWSIQDGKLNFVPLTSYIPGPKPVISAATGLIGIPEQTQQGIRMRVLLNPSIKIGTCVKLDNASAINLYRYSLDLNSQGSNRFLSTAIKTNADGLYYVMVANHSGDTRGTDWYTDIVCLAVDATVPDVDALNALIAVSADSIKKIS